MLILNVKTSNVSELLPIYLYDKYYKALNIFSYLRESMKITIFTYSLCFLFTLLIRPIVGLKLLFKTIFSKDYNFEDVWKPHFLMLNIVEQLSLSVTTFFQMLIYPHMENMTF